MYDILSLVSQQRGVVASCVDEMSAAVALHDKQVDASHFELSGVHDDHVRRALASFASAKNLELAPAAPSALQLMSETRQAIALVRRSMVHDMDVGMQNTGRDEPSSKANSPMASSEEVAASLAELQQATEACRGFNVPRAGATARSAAPSVIARLRPTVAPPAGASLLPDDETAVEEREDLEAARAAWHAARRQQLLAAGAAAGDAGGCGGEGGYGGATHEATIMLKMGAGRARRVSVPTYLLQQQPPATDVDGEGNGDGPYNSLNITSSGGGWQSSTHSTQDGRRPRSLTIPAVNVQQWPYARVSSPPITCPSPLSKSSQEQVAYAHPLADTQPPRSGRSTPQPPSSSSSASNLGEAGWRQRAPSSFGTHLNSPDGAAAATAGRTRRPARRVASVLSLAGEPRPPAPPTITSPGSRLGLRRGGSIESSLLSSPAPIASGSPTSGSGVAPLALEGARQALRRRSSVQLLTSTNSFRMPGGVGSHSSSALRQSGPGMWLGSTSNGEEAPGSSGAVGRPGAVGMPSSPLFSATCPQLPRLSMVGARRPSFDEGEAGAGLSSMFAALATGHAEVERVRRKVGAMGVGMNRANVEAARDHLDVSPLWHH